MENYIIHFALLLIICLVTFKRKCKIISFNRLKDGDYAVVYIQKNISKNYYVTHTAIFHYSDKQIYLVKFHNDDFEQKNSSYYCNLEIGKTFLARKEGNDLKIM